MPEAALVFLLSAAFNIYRCAPGLTTGDAGELAAASSVLGVAHAPGYPLFALLGRVFGVLMPFGSWAHRMNLMSAVLSAGSLALMTDALKRWNFSLHSRLSAVLLLSLTSCYLSTSSVTEVFALHGFLASLLLWLVSHDDAVRPEKSFVVGLTFGLALANHQTSILLLPCLLMIPGLRARSVAFAALGALAGFSVYLYLPLRAAASPPLDWGHAVNLKSFLHVLLRKDYGSFALTTDGAQDTGYLAQAWRGLSFMGLFPAALCIAGVALWPKDVKPVKKSVLAWVLLSGPFFLMMGRPGFDAQTSNALTRFALLPLIGSAVLFAAGLHRAGPMASVAAVLAMLATTHIPSSRQSFLAHDYGRSLFDQLPKDSLFIMDGGDDTFYSTMALRHTQGLRPDIELRDRGGVVFPGLYGPDFRSLSRDEKDVRRRSVETALVPSGRLWYSSLNASVLPGFDAVPAGLLRRPLPPGAPFPDAAALDAAVAVRLSREAWDGYRDPALAAFIPFSRGASALAAGRLDDAVSWYELASGIAPDALWLPSAVSYGLGVAGYQAMMLKRYALAERAYRGWLDLAPRSAEAWVNLGSSLERQGRLEDAVAAYRKAQAVEPAQARPWAALGALEWARGNWFDAAAAFDQAAFREPQNPAHAGYAAAARRKAPRNR